MEYTKSAVTSVHALISPNSHVSEVATGLLQLLPADALARDVQISFYYEPAYMRDGVRVVHTTTERSTS